MRCLPRLIVMLLIVAVLGAIGDSAARRLVEGQIAGQVRSAQGFTSTPEVTIHGWPFLTQLVSGRFEDIEVTSRQVATGTTQQDLQVDSVQARLRGVRVPIRDLISSGTPQVQVDSAQVSGVVPYSTLSRLLANRVGSTFTDVAMRPRSADSLTLTGSYRGVALQLPVQVRLTGTRLALSVPAADAAASPVLAAAAGRISLQLTVPTLPYGLKVTSLQVQDDGLHLSASASRLRLIG